MLICRAQPINWDRDLAPVSGIQAHGRVGLFDERSADLELAAAVLPQTRFGLLSK